MYKVVYAKDSEQRKLDPYKLVAIFDVAYTQMLGADDADYSQIDMLIALLATNGEVHSKEYQSLGEISTVLEATNQTGD